MDVTTAPELCSFQGPDSSWKSEMHRFKFVKDIQQIQLYLVSDFKHCCIYAQLKVFPGKA